jgi:hypothetical protein
MIGGDARGQGHGGRLRSLEAHAIREARHHREPVHVAVSRAVALVARAEAIRQAERHPEIARQAGPRCR